MTTSMGDHDDLVRSILNIDRERLLRLYQESAEFHAAVEAIASILHPLIGLIADDAVKSMERRRQLAEAMARQGPPRLTAEEIARLRGDPPS